eukprot:scaffold16670_cov110-Isochrysis_galbana.AAC.6
MNRATVPSERTSWPHAPSTSVLSLSESAPAIVSKTELGLERHRQPAANPFKENKTRGAGVNTSKRGAARAAPPGRQCLHARSERCVALRLAKRHGALEVRVGRVTIVLHDHSRACSTRTPKAPTRRTGGAAAAQAQQPARTALAQPACSAPSQSAAPPAPGMNSRQRRSAARLAVFQAAQRSRMESERDAACNDSTSPESTLAAAPTAPRAEREDQEGGGRGAEVQVPPTFATQVLTHLVWAECAPPAHHLHELLGTIGVALVNGQGRVWCTWCKPLSPNSWDHQGPRMPGRLPIVLV